MKTVPLSTLMDRLDYWPEDNDKHAMKAYRKNCVTVRAAVAQMEEPPSGMPEPTGDLRHIVFYNVKVWASKFLQWVNDDLPRNTRARLKNTQVIVSETQP